MRRGRLRRGFEEPSLVPLADMLTNTVGIMLFILIFTVLVSGDAVVFKRFPIEQKTNLDPIMFICSNNNILPQELQSLAGKFRSQMIEPMGRPRTSNEVKEWLERANGLRMETKDYILEASAGISKRLIGRSLTLTVICIPREDGGDTIADLQREPDLFVHSLSEHDPKRSFVYFFVRTDSLDIFEIVRDIARSNNFDVGWSPLPSDRGVAFALDSEGQGEIVPVPQ